MLGLLECTNIEYDTLHFDKITGTCNIDDYQILTASCFVYLDASVSSLVTVLMKYRNCMNVLEMNQIAEYLKPLNFGGRQGCSAGK